MNHKRKQLRGLAVGGIMAALYLALCFVFATLSYATVQFRVAEALMLLTPFSPWIVGGVTLGCLLFNILNPFNLGLIDIVFGTLATALAAGITYYLGRRVLGNPPVVKRRKLGFWLLPLPTILCNALIVGTYLPFLLTEGQVTLGLVLLNWLSVGLGEAVVTYALGLPLLAGVLRSQVFKTLY